MALDKTIQFRADSQEKEHLAKAAADAGMKLSVYLRSVALSRTVVVVGESVGVVVIPATDSPTAQDSRIMAAVQAAIEQLNDQAPNPTASDGNAAVAPSDSGSVQPGPEGDGEASEPGTPAPVPDVEAPLPGAPAPSPSGPATSPGEGEATAGAAVSQVPPVATPQLADEGLEPAAGAIPGPEETLKGDDALEPNGAGACPHCGGTNGRHQSFCEEVTGESPVPDSAPPSATPPEPEGAVIESKEQFVARRVGEGENQLIAEAEWRRQTSSGQAPATEMVVCPQCGTTKSAALVCPDCGAPPPVTPTKGNR